LNGLADDADVAVEYGLPKTIADDGDLLPSCDRLFGEEVTTEGGMDAEDVEQVGLSNDSADEMRMVAAAEADAS
jgi:hypothetical protein